MKRALPILLAASVLPAGCGILQGRREVPGAVYPEEFVSIMTPTPAAPAPPPTAPPRPTQTPPLSPARLTEDCERVIEDDNLSDVLKHRELFSIALQLEFKGRKNEAIAALREALKYRPENKLTRMKLAELTGEVASSAEAEGGPTPPEEAGAAASAAEEVPPGIDLSGDYFDIVNNDNLSRCAKGFKFFVMASKAEDEGKATEALFLYEKAVSLCPEEDGPNTTINREAAVKIGLLKKKVKAGEAKRAAEESGKIAPP
jgi:tetratricopeptide (TPR) repeat protein